MDPEKKLKEDVVEQPSTCSESSLSTVAADTENDIVQGELSEYECQYLGFTPKSLINGVYNAVITNLREGLTHMEAYINEGYGTTITPEKTKQAMETIQSVLVEKLDKKFDHVESYLLKNVFTIPEDVVLPEDRVQMTHPLSPEEDRQLDTEMEQLRKHIIAVRYGNECVRQQVSDIENLQKHADNTLLYLQQLDSTATDAGVLGIKDSLSFVLDKTKDLMSAVNGLENEPKGSTNSTSG